MENEFFEDFLERDAFKEFAIFTEEEYKLIGMRNPKTFPTFKEFYMYFLLLVGKFKKDNDLFESFYFKPSRYIQHKINQAEKTNKDGDA